MGAVNGQVVSGIVGQRQLYLTVLPQASRVVTAQDKVLHQCIRIYVSASSCTLQTYMPAIVVRYQVYAIAPQYRTCMGQFVLRCSPYVNWR